MPGAVRRTQTGHPKRQILHLPEASGLKVAVSSATNLIAKSIEGGISVDFPNYASSHGHWGRLSAENDDPADVILAFSVEARWSFGNRGEVGVRIPAFG